MPGKSSCCSGPSCPCLLQLPCPSQQHLCGASVKPTHPSCLALCLWGRTGDSCRRGQRTQVTASCPFKGHQATSSMFCSCIVGPPPASRLGLAFSGLRFHWCFSLAARIASLSCFTCMTTMAISLTAPCAARAESCCSAAT